MYPSGLQAAYIPALIPTYWTKTLVSYFLWKRHSHVIILFFVDFYLIALILLRWQTYHFTLQTSSNAVKHGRKNCYNHLQYFGDLWHIVSLPSTFLYQYVLDERSTRFDMLK
jgi:hypothetical protein